MARKAGKERVDVLLVELGLCESRAKAQARVLAGEVVVDDQRVDKPGTQISRDAQIRLKGEGLKWVSRGGLKLAGALAHFQISPAGEIWVDVGASTGGFTHVLLEHGARQVYAIDVGYGQLAWQLRQDERVRNLERTHIGKMPLGTLDPPPLGFVIDVSFISLDLVLPALVPHLAANARGVALIKPQFEVGRDGVGKGGIVRDDAVRQRAVDRVLGNARELGLEVLGCTESAIRGTDGNIEYVAAFRWRDGASANPVGLVRHPHSEAGKRTPPPSESE